MQIEKKIFNLTFSETKHVYVMSVCKTGLVLKCRLIHVCLTILFASQADFVFCVKNLYTLFTITEIDIKSQYLSCRRAVNKSSPGRYYSSPVKFSSSCLLTQKIAD